jgi:hypothetical protein
VNTRVLILPGRVCSHPRAIDVEVAGGVVTLRGPVLSNEIADVLATVRDVRGVSSVANELIPHESGEGVPALQGNGRVGQPALDILQNNWAPATRAVVAAGLVATAVCMAAYTRRL